MLSSITVQVYVHTVAEEGGIVALEPEIKRTTNTLHHIKGPDSRCNLIDSLKMKERKKRPAAS